MMKSSIYRIFSILPESKNKEKIRKIGATKFQKYLYNDILNDISKLEIINSGIKDNLPFVKLKDGSIFYGHFPNKTKELLYNNLPEKTKNKLEKKSMQVAIDIVNRFKKKDIKQKYYKVKPGDTVLEAGAYLGFYTIKLAKEVGPSGKIIAIEALEDNFNILKRNIIANNIKNIVLINKAIWSSCKTLPFYINARHDKKQGNSLFKIRKSEQKKYKEIKTETIDNIIKKLKLNRIDFTIIEINGAEVEALKGADKSLEIVKNLVVAAPYKTGKEKNYINIKDILSERKFNTKVEYRPGSHKIGTIYGNKK